MKKYVISLLVVAMAFVVIINCGSEPTAPEQQPDPTPIIVTEPGSATSWIWYDTDLQVGWSGGDGDLVSINLYKGDSHIQELTSTAANNGSYTWAGPVPSSWDPGSNFSIHIKDNTGIEGVSSDFSILACEGEDIIDVSSPSSGYEWQHFSTGYLVEWTYPGSSKSDGNRGISIDIRSGNPPLDADNVDIELWYNGSLVSVLAEDVSTSETGSWTMSQQVPSEWTVGSGYSIRVIDNLDNYGTSGIFSVVPCEGSEIITISEPNSSTVWEHSETNTQVIWEYPSNKGGNALDSHPSDMLLSNPMSPLSGDSVRIEIWQGGSKIDDYSSWIPNAGSYTRSEGIPGSWGVGTGFTLKLIDNYDNFGFSEQFEITNESLVVTQPTSSTEWDHYETDTEVQWNYPSGGGSPEVLIELWRDGSYFTDYSPGWVSNTGSYVRSEGIPPTWGTSNTHTYTIHVEDSYGSEDFSDEFTINESEIFTFTSPTSDSTWRHYVSGYEISWDNPSYLESDSVEIDLYKGGQYLEEVSPMLLNTGSYIITDPISEALEPGNDYQILITDEYDDYGFSEEFTIEASTGEEIVTITSPASDTTWGHYQENTQVVWEYPRNRDTRLSYDSVKVDIYKGGVYLADYTDGWVANTFSYTRTDGIDASWGIGDDYQLYLEDSNGNYGWSDSFAIENADIIDITDPANGSIWMHYSTDNPIQWESAGLLSDSLDIQLYKGGVFEVSLASGVSNSGSWTYSGPLPDTLTTGTDYQIYIVDNYGDWGWSDEFEIALSSGADVIEVTEPESGDVWEQFQTGYQVAWNYPQSNMIRSTGIGMIDRMASLYSPLSGDEVLITILQGGSVVDTLGGGWLTNTGVYTLTEQVSYFWGTGSDYQIRIEDDLSNYGTGEYFQIVSPGAGEIITVTYPTSSTSWGHYEGNTQVTWEYPALDTPLFQDSVKLEVWTNGGSTYLDDYSDGWVDNTTSYTRPEGIPAEWGIGSTYQIKITDGTGNYGWSDSFTIENADVISITEPSSSTTWMHYSVDNSILWDTTGITSDEVIIQLFRGSSFTATLVSGVSNSGEWTYAGPVPDSWITATNYRVKITDTYGDWGWSDEFEITESSGQTIYQITDPDSSTTWTHFDTDLPITWSLMYDNDSDDSMIRRIASGLLRAPLSGDSVRIELWKGGAPLVALTNSTPNDSQWTYPGPLPTDWEAGTDYQIRVVDNLNNRGMSEQFTIDPSSGQEVITVSEPNSTTTWEHYETNTQVVWNYPAVLSGDSVVIDIYRGGTYVAEYSGGYVANSGSFVRAAAIPSEWTESNNYQLRIYDDLGNFGWSESFEIIGVDTIDVTDPNSSTVWMHYSEMHTVSWDTLNVPGSTVSITIFRDTAQVAVLTPSTPNDGSWVYPGPISDGWLPSTDYSLLIETNYGDYGYSDQFEVAESVGQEIYELTNPASDTTWTHFDTDLSIAWSLQLDQAGNANILSSVLASLGNAPLVGDNVRIEIHKGGVIVDTLQTSTPNDYLWYYGGPVPMEWVPGSDYQIKIIDDLGNWGISEQFTINPSSNQEVITVTDPTSSTTWEHYETNTQVVWNYPAIDAPLSGDEVLLQLYSGATYVADYSGGYITNTGTYTRTEGINPAWGTGSNYRIKVLDNLGNFGWSDSFTVNNVEIIPVSEPSSSTEWMQYSSNHSITWDSTGIAGVNVTIDIYKNGSFVETLSSSTSNDGSWVYTGPVPGSWTADTDYQIKVTDTYGDYGYSDQFEVTESSGQEIYQISDPSAVTTWTHFDTDLPINWNTQSDEGGANALLTSMTNNTARVLAGSNTGILGRMFAGWNSSSLSGDSVTIELHKGGSLLVTLTASTYNDNSWIYAGPVPMEWVPGSDYQIKVIDNLSNWGISDQFTVETVTGQEIIIVTEPSISTEWCSLEPMTQVNWEYPSKAESFLVKLIPFAEEMISRAARVNGILSSDSISIEIWKDTVYLANYSNGAVPNTGSYTRSEAIPSSWGTGNTYQIKVIDTNSNFGYSESFTISAGEIDVTLPVASTIWEIGETGVQTNWSGGSSVVKLELWSYGELVDGDFSPWMTNTGSFTYPTPAPSSWDIGEHYQIHVMNYDSTEHGWSEEFQIFNEIEISQPDSQTIWAWSVDSLTIQWDDPFGDSVYVDIYKGGTYLDSFLSWTPNGGSEVRLPAIPSSWGTGEDFQLRIENNKGSYGVSDEFSIWAIEVIEPNLNTEWELREVNTEVIWGDAPGSLVRLVVCHEGDSIGCFNDPGEWLDAADGNYTRTASIPVEWGYGNGYQIKIVDIEGNIGCSEEYTISMDVVYLDQFNRTLSFAGNWGIPDIGGSYSYENPSHADFVISSNTGYVNDFNSQYDPRAISIFETTTSNYVLEFSWKYQGGDGSGIRLHSDNTTIITILQDRNPDVVRFNGIIIENMTPWTWKNYKIVVEGTNACVYINEILKLSTTVNQSSVDNIQYWALGPGWVSDSWYDNVTISTY